MLTIQQIEVPEAVITLEQDPYLSSSVPIFQVEATKEMSQDKHDGGKERLLIAYPTPSPTVSREQSQEAELVENTFVDDLDVLKDSGMAGASIYLGAFSSTLVTKRSMGGNPKIHRDQLAPPPTSWKELMKHPYKSEILTATHLEFNHLMKETLEVDNEYKGHTVPLKWIWTYKFDSNGFLTKFKSRLCVRGDLQLPTLQETYAATLAMKTFRAMMALMCAFNLESRQYDLVNAFCNAKLSTPMYCNTPPGFEYLGKTLCQIKYVCFWKDT
ncbi:hypothetical protein K3495_g10984 [Podosphaera aphanis]|nr:hypothetical protein K3495_g10984 [Podosphaera aphanis]